MSAAEVGEFGDVVEDTILTHADDFWSGFVHESPEKLRRIPRYYAALGGYAEFPPVSCNAPHVSVVVEADGAVRPCFFHDAIGSIRREGLGAIVRNNLRTFRAGWSVGENPVCRRCVCALRTTMRSAPWQ